MKSKYFLFIIFLVSGVYAEETAKPQKEKTEIKIKGILEAGFDINNKVNKSETDHKKIGNGKIEISARPVKDIKAEFGFEYKHKDSALTIDKLYGQYNFTSLDGIRAGYMKKSFGLEESAGLEERFFHKRSIINDGLEYFGFLGHDLTLQYRRNLNEKWKLTGGLSWAEDTLRYLQNYSIEYDAKSTNIILATIIRHYTVQNIITAFVSSLSFKHFRKLYVSEAELTFGSNPAVKYLEERDAFIFGARAQEYFPIKTKWKALRQIIPLAEAVVYSEELESRIFETQLRAGLTLGFAKKSAFQWRNTYGVISRIEDGERELRRRRFDSEVVVIF
ncbi:MAG: hypothetical protein LBH25_11865 [Fibromonadaceae bacterium]|jgi:hypothetical protein|nr:hypothetical protein [Fibromonadaceae bacterium]